jgi:hypothetical protein
MGVAALPKAKSQMRRPRSMVSASSARVVAAAGAAATTAASNISNASSR